MFVQFLVEVHFIIKSLALGQRATRVVKPWHLLNMTHQQQAHGVELCQLCVDGVGICEEEGAHEARHLQACVTQRHVHAPHSGQHGPVVLL